MSFLTAPFRRFLDAFDAVLRTGGLASLAWVLAGLALGWWAYVPLHELLHAAGCLWSGGEVEKLEMSPLYGAHLWASLFDFVSPGGPYAGRLSEFDTGGSDLVYALTVSAAFLPGLAGFPLLGLSRRRPLLFGAASLLAASPLLSLAGDMYELGSLALFQIWPGPGEAHRALVSDDLFRLLGRPKASPLWFIALAQFLGAVFAWALLWLSLGLAKLIPPGNRSG